MNKKKFEELFGKLNDDVVINISIGELKEKLLSETSLKKTKKTKEICATLVSSKECILDLSSCYNDIEPGAINTYYHNLIKRRLIDAKTSSKDFYQCIKGPISVGTKKINWIGKKSQLHNFCRFILGYKNNIPWSKIDNFFLFKGKYAATSNAVATSLYTYDEDVKLFRE